MRQIIKFPFFLISILIIFAGCVSKTKYDKVIAENTKLKDSLQSLVDIYINGENDFLHADSLFKNRKFVDAKDAFVDYKIKYPKTKFLNAVDTTLKEINKQSVEMPYSSSLSYLYFHNAYASIKSDDLYSVAESYFSNGVTEFDKLQLASDSTEIREFKKFMNNYMNTFEKYISYDDFDLERSIRFTTFNALCGHRLELYGNQIKILELKNE